MKKFLNLFLQSNSYISRWLPVFLWAGVIFYFSSQPHLHGSQFYWVDFFIKKSAHISEYAILYLLVFRATQKKWLTSLFIVLGYAISDEIHQAFVPGRSPHIYDVLGFDLAGVIICALVIWYILQIRQKRLKK